MAVRPFSLDPISAVLVPLYGRPGLVGFAVIDSADAAQLRHRWNVTKRGYVLRRTGPRHNHRTVYLAREVMGVTFGERAPDGRRLVVDHVNKNTLDNRRSNLRVGTQVLNMQNRGANNGRVLPHGVRRHRFGRYEAYSKMLGKYQYLGLHDTPEAAAEAVRRFRESNMPWSPEAMSA